MTFVKMNNPPHLELNVSIAKFKVIKNGNSNRKFIWLHGDEKTAKMALEYHIKRYPGTAYLIENDSREINIKNGIIDPNRMVRTLYYNKDVQFRIYLSEKLVGVS